MIIKFIAVIMLLSPILHLLHLHVHRGRYSATLTMAFYGIAAAFSVYLLIVRHESALAFLICSTVSCLLTVVVEKIYNHILNSVVISIIEAISDTEVLSKLVLRRDEAYALTSKGYIVVKYKEKEYLLYENYNEIPDKTRAIFSSLKLMNSHD